MIILPTSWKVFGFVRTYKENIVISGSMHVTYCVVKLCTYLPGGSDVMSGLD